MCTLELFEPARADRWGYTRREKMKGGEQGALAQPHPPRRLATPPKYDLDRKLIYTTDGRVRCFVK